MAIPPVIAQLLADLDAIMEAATQAHTIVRGGVQELRKVDDPRIEPALTQWQLQEIRDRATPFLTTIKDAARRIP